MFGKWFAQTYTGSMFGAGPSVFAVWGYVVAHMYFGTVELNPSVIAAALGDSRDNVERVLEYLCAPDPKSRSKIEEGRRLVREGEYLYRVPTGNLYRGMRDEHDRRAYNRKKKAESRRNQQSNSQDVSTCESNNVSRRQPPSAAVSRRQPPSAHNREQITDNREQKESKSKARARFAPPSLAEVTDYVAERQSTVSPQAFVAFYESKGWKVGNQPMKDWKAAVRTWEQRVANEQRKRFGATPGANGIDLKRQAVERLKR